KERQARYQRIADAASEQCGRTIPLRIHPVASFSDALGTHRKTDTIVLLWEGETELALDQVLRGNAPSRLSLFVGPEGGFTESEARLAREHGALCASLGKRILRAETAGIVACALFQYCWGDLGRRQGEEPLKG
ncbi:MAG: RNA methyltransferase, partial [Armatimonadetes bacterium]|nr:RNA methyltransferase [Armatimonadota bacterium]